MNTAYRFLINLPSSLLAGRIIALYGPSTSNSMLISELVLYVRFSGSIRVWYWSFVHITAVRRFSTEHGYDILSGLKTPRNPTWAAG